MPIPEFHINQIIENALKDNFETACIEFKHNNCNPQEIGEYISALANTAALYNREHAFIIWGIDDSTHQLVGTNFDPQKVKQGNQGLDLWISTQLTPQVEFYFHKTVLNGFNLVLLEINRAKNMPVQFKSVEYIRIDSYKKKLKEFPETERALWRAFSNLKFETLPALENVTADNITKLIDYDAFFDMLSLSLPSNRDGIIDALISNDLVSLNETGNYNITNLGAILFAKKLSEFPSLARKAIRVIKYDGNDRMSSASKEQVGSKGYANGFSGLIDYINNLLPNNEVLGKALRKVIPMYPDVAIRELVANALIHQNFFISGTGPLIEIFSNRLEITNPGVPLIDQNRFVDHPPVSRNEKLATFMRRIGVCEERGSGYDKIILQTELYQLPAPDIEIYPDHTKITLFAHIEFSKMTKNDKIRACYYHACLKRVNRDFVTNSSLRERFKIDHKNISVVSRLLAEACERGLIKISVDSTSDKNRKYLPFWA